MKRILLTIALLAVTILIATAVIPRERPAPAPVPSPKTEPSAPAANLPEPSPSGEVQHIRAPHFVDSAPAHGDELAAPPLHVVVNTNFDLVPPSSISVTVNGADVADGETVIDASRLAMRRTIRRDAPDGTYLVRYRACWPDQSCHDGQFAFTVDHSRLQSYTDLRGQGIVTVKMTDQFRFVPDAMIVSPGTHLIWINDGETPHYVNTDPHPTHNYYPAQNSMVLLEGESYELTLNDPGEYLYHCSAHYPDHMVARVVVAP